MQKGNYISTILRSKKTVFSFKDIVLLWNESNLNAARVRVNYFVKNGELIHLRRGLYAKDNNYNKLELATKIFTPAYVSFETVLAQEGVTFQYYGNIFVASYLTREIEVDGQIYVFKKMKDFALSDSVGIKNENEQSIASKERAFLDVIYINKDYHFDNLGSLNWEKVFEILPIYDNQRMTNKVQEFFKDFKKQVNKY